MSLFLFIEVWEKVRKESECTKKKSEDLSSDGCFFQTSIHILSPFLRVMQPSLSPLHSMFNVSKNTFKKMSLPDIDPFTFLPFLSVCASALSAIASLFCKSSKNGSAIFQVIHRIPPPQTDLYYTIPHSVPSFLPRSAFFILCPWIMVNKNEEKRKIFFRITKIDRKHWPPF